MRCTIIMFKALFILGLAYSPLMGQSDFTSEDSLQVFKKFHFGIIGDYQTGAVDLVHAPSTSTVHADGYSVKSIGAVLEYNFNPSIGIGVQPKVAFNEHMLRYTGGDQYREESLKTNYFQLPLYMTYTYNFKNASPFISMGMSPNFKLTEDGSEAVESADVFFEGFMKIGLGIKQQNITFAPFLAFNKSATEIYKFQNQYSLNQSATRLGLSFGLAILY